MPGQHLQQEARTATGTYVPVALSRLGQPEIGGGFVEDGISWISGVIERTPDLDSRELEVNTIYYLENLVRDYLLQNRHKVRTTLQTQHQVLTILNFLLAKGSATAYLLREDIL